MAFLLVLSVAVTGFFVLAAFLDAAGFLDGRCGCPDCSRARRDITKPY